MQNVNQKTILLVGLGNPGDEHEHTPHNLGRVCVRKFITDTQSAGVNFSPDPLRKSASEASREKSLQGAPTFHFEKKFNAQTDEVVRGEQKCIAALPETFMNNSGEAVAALAQFYKIPPENVWIVHDDIDIPLGGVRIAFGGGAAGHNGIKSVIEKLGTPDFWRFRIGIAPSEHLEIPLDAYVLKKNIVSETQKDAIQKKVFALLDAALEKGAEAVKNISD